MSKVVTVAQVLAGLKSAKRPLPSAKYEKLVGAAQSAPLVPTPKSLARPPAF